MTDKEPTDKELLGFSKQAPMDFRPGVMIAPDHPPLPRSFATAMESFYNARRARNEGKAEEAAKHSQKCLDALQAILPTLVDITNQLSILGRMADTALEAGFYDKVVSIVDQGPELLSGNMEIAGGSARLLRKLPGWEVDWQALELDQSGADLVMTRDDLSVTILFDTDQFGMEIKEGSWPSMVLSLPFEDSAITEACIYISYWYSRTLPMSPKAKKLLASFSQRPTGEDWHKLIY